MLSFRVWAVALAASLAGWVMAAPASAASIAGGTAMVSLNTGKSVDNSVVQVRQRRCGRRCFGGRRAGNGPRAYRGPRANRGPSANRGPRANRGSRANRGPRVSNGPRRRGQARGNRGQRRQLASRHVGKHALRHGGPRKARKRAHARRHGAKKRRYGHKRRHAHKSYRHFKKHCRHRHKCGRHKRRHGHYKHYYGGWYYGWPWWSIGWPYYGYRASYYAYDYYDDPHVAYCLGRYKSYVPERDQYLSYSGVWRYCRSPYRG